MSTRGLYWAISYACLAISGLRVGSGARASTGTFAPTAAVRLAVAPATSVFCRVAARIGLHFMALPWFMWASDFWRTQGAAFRHFVVGFEAADVLPDDVLLDQLFDIFQLCDFVCTDQ